MKVYGLYNGNHVVSVQVNGYDLLEEAGIQKCARELGTVSSLLEWGGKGLGESYVAVLYYNSPEGRKTTSLSIQEVKQLTREGS